MGGSRPRPPSMVCREAHRTAACEPSEQRPSVCVVRKPPITSPRPTNADVPIVRVVQLTAYGYGAHTVTVPPLALPPPFLAPSPIYLLLTSLSVDQPGRLAACLLVWASKLVQQLEASARLRRPRRLRFLRVARFFFIRGHTPGLPK